MNPTIQIDNLKLTLPPQWRGKARLFAHYLSHRLSALEIQENRQIDRLEIPPITTHAGESYQTVARRVARQIGDQLSALPSNHTNAPRSLQTPPTTQKDTHA